MRAATIFLLELAWLLAFGLILPHAIAFLLALPEPLGLLGFLGLLVVFFGGVAAIWAA